MDMNNFLSISSNVEGKTFILDVDGTLVEDKNEIISKETIEKIKELSKKNTVYICSNGSPQNAKSFSKITNTNFLSAKKPFVFGIDKDLLNKEYKIVVGDKYLTDGLFALNSGSDFMKVDHLKSGKEPLFIKVTYMVDDIVWFFIPYIKLIRPWHWVKNTLVFAPLFFAGYFLHYSYFKNALIAAAVFSIFASLMYIFNDIVDVDADKLHPIKKSRPIASGQVTRFGLLLLVSLLVILGLIFLYILPSIISIIFIYVVLNFLYTLFLKKIPVVDVILVSVFYVLRILTGGISTGVYISPWIVLCVFFGSLFVVFGKRLAEFHRVERRAVLNHYSESSLTQLFSGSAVVAIVVYSIWSVLGHHSQYLVYSTVFVSIAIFELVNRIHTGDYHFESPEILVFKDKVVLASFICWVLYVSFVFYM